MEKKFVEISGIKLAYLDTGGDGQPVVLIHGNSSSANTYHLQLESELANKMRLIAVDLPGHGESGRVPVAEYGLPFYARRVAALMSTLDVDDAVLVGWSLGGHVALEATALLPAAKGFMIYGTPPLRQPPNLEEAFLPDPTFAVGMTGTLTEADAANYARGFLGDTGNAELEAAFVLEIMATDPNARNGLAMSVGVPYLDEVDVVENLDKPLAVIHGAQERFVGVEYLKRLDMPTLWRGEIQVIENAGHAPHVEQTAIFNQLLADFVEDLA